MLELLSLLFSWLPGELSGIAIAFVCLFVLVFFIGIIIRIIEIIRG